MSNQREETFRDEVQRAAMYANKIYETAGHYDSTKMTEAQAAVAATGPLVFGSSLDGTAIPQVEGIAGGCVLIVNDHLQWLLGTIERQRVKIETIAHAASAGYCCSGGTDCKCVCHRG